MFTETGYSNDQSFPAMMKIFERLYHNRYPGVNATVFMDRLSSHCSAALLEAMRSTGIRLVLFPAGTTQFIQPLDDVAFALFKSLLKEYRDRYLSRQPFGVVRNSSPLLLAMIDALRASLTPQAISRSFENTGIYPFDRETILARARQAYPVESVDDHVLGTTVTEIMDAITETHRPKETAVMTPFKIHRSKLSGTFLLEDFVAEDARYAAEKEKLALDKAAEKEKKAEKIAKRKRQAAVEKSRREAERIEKKRHLEANKEERRAKRLAATCQFCPSVRQSSTKWWNCVACSDFLLCPKCQQKPNHHADFTSHTESCPFPAKTPDSGPSGALGLDLIGLFSGDSPILPIIQ